MDSQNSCCSTVWCIRSELLVPAEKLPKRAAQNPDLEESHGPHALDLALHQTFRLRKSRPKRAANWGAVHSPLPYSSALTPAVL